MTDRRWYALGRFQILAKPLAENPYWTTHHIYLDGTCIGRQLSVPSLADCEQKVCILPPTSTMRPFSYGRLPPRRLGRPRKDHAEQELTEAIEAG